MISNIQGIEGDDIPYHLGLLGYDVKHISDRYYFFPLNDHYNTHGSTWLSSVTKQAQHSNVVVFYDLVNTGDYEHEHFKTFIREFVHPHKVYLTVNQSRKLNLGPSVRIVQWDFMWNRTKAYYTQKPPSTLRLHHYRQDAYTLNDLNFDKSRSKNFLSLLGREYGHRTLHYDFVSNYSHCGYISNRSKGITLEKNSNVVGVYTPVSNIFYDETYFSTYVESNSVQTDLIHLTEKTFEPLLKGHAILPFTNPYAIERLSNMGFKNVNFINYAFDTVEDHATRFEMVKQEFSRLLGTDLQKSYFDNKSVIQHNRQCLHDIPYDNRILEIFDV